MLTVLICLFRDFHYICKRENENYVPEEFQLRRNVDNVYHAFIGPITLEPSAMPMQFQYARNMINNTCSAETRQNPAGENVTFSCGCPDGFDLVSVTH